MCGAHNPSRVLDKCSYEKQAETQILFNSVQLEIVFKLINIMQITLLETWQKDVEDSKADKTVGRYDKLYIIGPKLCLPLTQPWDRG